MNLFLYFILFCMGTVFGSFFTLAVYRIPLKKDITHERSFCPNCNHKLSFFDLIPILSYVFLGGKCRYCKQKIRPRYLLLEVLSGTVFVLFAFSININLFTITLSQVVYLIFGFLYLAMLFLIAGIDKEKVQIENGLLLFGYLTQMMYIIYLYIVEKEPNMYRYVIYFLVSCILLILHTVLLRKHAKNSYPVQIVLLCILMAMFTNEIVFALTAIFTLLAIAIQMLLQKITSNASKKHCAPNKTKSTPVPIAFYLCVTNIICLLATNFVCFH